MADETPLPADLDTAHRVIGSLARRLALRFENEQKLTAERDSMVRDLLQAVYPGDPMPDRPLDTVWNHLLDQVRKASTARPRLVSGDIPITERTPHGVWIADGPDPAPHPNPDLPDCDGLFGCDACRAYDELRQHLVEQIMLLDQQRQDETSALRAEVTDRIERYANNLVVAARMDDLIGTAEAAARNPIKSDLIELAASLRGGKPTDDYNDDLIPGRHVPAPPSRAHAHGGLELADGGSLVVTEPSEVVAFTQHGEVPRG